MIAASMHQRVPLMASAAPGAPMAGNPNFPKTNTQHSPRFTRLAPSETIIPGRGRPMLSRKAEVAMNIRIAGMPGANIQMTYRPQWAAVGRSWSTRGRILARHDPGAHGAADYSSPSPPRYRPTDRQ